MSYAHINGAQLHYDTYGADPPDQPPVPILLIHGAMSTGRADWHEVVPLLARRCRVVVPDCRGHGYSTNPERSYRLREMADDLAELVHRLGYTRAHVVGHSNGGNIGLVMLLEHSEAVQTCTLQAANAYVSPDLCNRLLRWEAAALGGPPTRWTRLQEALHGPMHGRDYWRELMSWTVTESTSEPCYTADDLQLATRPVLVVQGAHDTINAAGGHGEYLARHIPDAESWFPAEAGHDVHLDQPCIWVERVCSFLDRHGDDANTALERLRRTAYADRRTTVFAVRASYHLPPAGQRADGAALNQSSEGAELQDDALDVTLLSEEVAAPEGYRTSWCVRLHGEVLTQDQRAAASGVVAELAQVAGQAAAVAVDDQVRVLLDDTAPWALLDRPFVDLLTGPGPLAERASQVLAGERLRVLREEDGWAYVQLETDGYLGWLPAATLSRSSAEDVLAYLAEPQAMVVAGVATAYARPSRSARTAGKLPYGAVLRLAELRAGWALLRLPGGADWWLPASEILALDTELYSDSVAVARALRSLRRWIGVPYLPGVRTAFGVDSAGLAQAFLRSLGVVAPRSADQQFRLGCPVTGRPRAGDLVFFAHEVSADDDPGVPRATQISHVAISLGGWQLLQAGGGALDVNVLGIGRPRTPAARWLRSHRAGVRRYTEAREDKEEVPCS